MPNTKAVGVAFSDPQLDGAVIGTTTGTAGFFGAAVTTRPASASQAAVTTSASVSISATQWGFATSTQADQLVNSHNAIRAALVSLGIIKGSA